MSKSKKEVKNKLEFFKSDLDDDKKESIDDRQHLLTSLLKDYRDNYSALKKQQQKVAEYCSEVSGKIKNYEQMEASYPGNPNVAAHLGYYREELKKSELQLLTLDKVLAKSEKQIHALENNDNNDSKPGSSSKGL